MDVNGNWCKTGANARGDDDHIHVKEKDKPSVRSYLVF
jgi:hypothetical protein